MDAAKEETQSPAQLAVLQVRNALGVAFRPDLALLRATGADVAAFLQNRTTNDVLALSPNEGHLNAVLDRQAKIQGLFVLSRQAEGFWLLTSQAEKANLIAQTLKYRILEQVDLQEVTGVTLFSLLGRQAAAFLSAWGGWAEAELPQTDLQTRTLRLNGETVHLMAQTEGGEPGFWLLAEAGEPERFRETLQKAVQAADGAILTAEALEILCLEAGEPQFGAEYDFETLLPETGLEQVAVSYTKGCYLGQETVARVKTYGMVPFALMGLLFAPDASLPPAGGDCLIDGKKVGWLTRSAFSPTLQRPIAIAYLGKSERIPGQRLTLSIAGQAYPVEVTLLPFYAAAETVVSAETLLETGLKRFAEGDDEASIEMLRRAITQNDQLIEAYEALGVILSRQERHPEAIEMMERVLVLDPQHVLAHTNLSIFYMRLGDKEKAEEEKAKATLAAFNRKAKESGLVFDLEAQRQRQDQALQDKIAMFEEALKASPTDPLGNFGLGSAFLELKRYAEAVAPLQAVLKAQPKHSVAYLSLGKAQEGAQQAEAARVTYQKGIEVAAAKGDLMPLKEMQARLAQLSG